MKPAVSWRQRGSKLINAAASAKGLPVVLNLGCMFLYLNL